MFIRKLVRAGASSFTVALPKEWITKNSLEKGNIVYINKISDNELILTAEPKEKKSPEREITFDIKVIPNPAFGDAMMEVTVQNPAPADLSVISADGKLLNQVKIPMLVRGKNQIPLSKIMSHIPKAGMYFMIIKVEDSIRSLPVFFGHSM